MKGRDLTRRQFIKSVGAGALGVGLASSLRPSKVSAQMPTLRILQWRHFVPPYDDWLNKVFAPKWGEKNQVTVKMDNVGLAEIPAIAAAQAARVAAGHDPGHDMIQFLSPPATFEPQAIDHTDLIREAEKKVGKYIPLAHLSTFNPVTKKFFGFSDNFVPDPVHYRADLWKKASAVVGGPPAPVTYDDILKVGRELKKMGNPVGFGLSQEIDTNMWLRSAMYSWGTGEQDAEGNVVIDVPPYRARTLDLLKYVRTLYRETMFPGVFAWTAATNNEEFLSGRISMAMNAISISRTAQANAAKALKDGKPASDPVVQMALNTEITERAPRGPEAARGLEHVMGAYLIWDTKKTEVIDKAKQFLLDLIESYDPDVAEKNGWGPGKFHGSQAYDYPTFENAIPKEKRLAFLKKDPVSKAAGDRPDKLLSIETAYEWAHNVGWPGPSNAAIDEVFNTFIIPVMFAQTSLDLLKPEEALDRAAAEMRKIYGKWRKAGLVGGTS